MTGVGLCNLPVERCLSYFSTPGCSIDLNGFFTERVMRRILNIGSEKRVMRISREPGESSLVMRNMRVEGGA